MIWSYNGIKVGILFFKDDDSIDLNSTDESQPTKRAEIHYYWHRSNHSNGPFYRLFLPEHV